MIAHRGRDAARADVEAAASSAPILTAWCEEGHGRRRRRRNRRTPRRPGDAPGARLRRIDAPGRRLDRAHEKFATLYATGCLAIEFGILPWQRERLLETPLSCTRSHVALVASEHADAALRQAAPLDLLRRYVLQNRGEFVDLRRRGIDITLGHDHRACPGYVDEHKDRGLEFLFSDWRFEQIVGGAAAARPLEAELARAGLIATEAGAAGDRHSVGRWIGSKADGMRDRRQGVAVRVTAFDQAP